MAASNGSSFVDSPFGSKLQIEALQTVMPLKPTDPRRSIRVCLDQSPISSGIFKRCFNIVLCYKKSSSAEEEDHGGPCGGSLVAGWIKESLGKAFSEQPMLGGRLRPNQDGEEGEMEMVSNDSGARLIEAKMAMTLAEFLEMKEKKEAEAELVFWEDLDHQEHNPQFSPLVYVQVTNFTCGGYSVGISSSLLLIDPFSMISFLERWTEIHIEMISRTDAPKIPVFYRPNLRNNSPSSCLPSSNTKPQPGQSLIFTIPTKVIDSDGEIHKKIAALCIAEAEQKLPRKTAPNFLLSFLVKEPSSSEAKIRNFTREELIQEPSLAAHKISSSAMMWEDLGAKEICFQEGNKPVNASCWINSVPGEAFLMIIPSPGKDHSGLKKIVVTLPL